MKKLFILLIILASIGLLMGVRATGSASSEPVVISTLYPPSNLDNTFDGFLYEFFWDEPIPGPPLSYRMYYSETPEDLESYSLFDETTGNSTWTDIVFEYVGYYVTAVYPIGESRRSNIIYLTMRQPIRVQLRIDSQTNSAVLSWEPVRNADSYLVYHADQASAAFPEEWQGPVNITENSFIDPLVNRKFYRVFARTEGRNRAIPESTQGAHKPVLGE